MRFSLCKLFLCSFLMLAGAVSGYAESIRWVHHPSIETYLFASDHACPAPLTITCEMSVYPIHTYAWIPCFGGGKYRGYFYDISNPSNDFRFLDGSPDYWCPGGWGGAPPTPPSPVSFFIPGPVWVDNCSYPSTDIYFRVSVNYDLNQFVESGSWDSFSPVNAWGVPVTLTIYRLSEQPPPWKYDCYFAIQGIAFFDGQTNKSVSYRLTLTPCVSPNSSPQVFTVSASGAYYQQSPLFHLDLQGDLLKSIVHYKWEVIAEGQTMLLTEADTSTSNPDEYIYLTKCDYTILNTNAPPVPPPAPTNQPPVPPDPTNQPPVTNYPPPPDPPVPTNNPPYPPYPPYPPWTNNPPPPQPPGPDTNTPPMPDPNPDGTNAISYDGIYSALRHALRDEGNAYDGAMPGDYPIDGAASGLMMQVAGYCSNLSRSAVQSASNTDLIIGRGYAILTSASGMLRDALPTSIGRIDSWSLPWFNNSAGITINLSQPPFALFISTFRSFIKWMMYLSAFWMIFRLLRRTFGRSE